MANFEGDVISALPRMLLKGIGGEGMAGLQHDDLKITRRVAGNKIEVIGEWERGCEWLAMRAYLNGELIRTTNGDNLTADAIALLDDVVTEIEPPNDETPEEGTP
jgi:hypothetical protein